MPTRPVRRLDASHNPFFGKGVLDYATGAEATQQSLRCRLLSVLQNWFLDLTHGIPWWQDETSDTQPIMGKRRDLQYAEAVLKTAILATDGVATLDSFAINTNTKTRKMTVTARGTTVDGGAFSIVDHGP